MSEKLLSENIVSQVRDAFAKMQHPVQILFFGAKEHCDYCDDTRQLLEEVAAIRSDMIGVSVYDIHLDADMARKFNVDKTPGTVIAAKEGDQVTDTGVQYSGIPSGHEFATLINAILAVSGRDSGLNPQTRDFLKKLARPVHMQVFVTPT
jgi:alkyl hydroperoxide reductase subunit AhpF